MTGTSTRDRILDAADSLFFTDGIAVTGVDRVADAAGVAIATLYKHVGSKDGLLTAVLTRRLNQWSEHWDAALAAAESPTERLLSVFDAVQTYRAVAVPAQWCSFLATRSERTNAAGRPDPVQELLDQDTRMITERLRTLADDAGAEDPIGLADKLALIYNGGLSSLLRGVPAESFAVAREVARVVVEDAV
ncbi:MAG: TetR/AcrR family transcriptional regulator [Rhodococcus sp. (in: high G+C Gram-positive bacteria)]